MSQTEQVIQSLKLSSTCWERYALLTEKKKYLYLFSNINFSPNFKYSSSYHVAQMMVQGFERIMMHS